MIKLNLQTLSTSREVRLVQSLNPLIMWLVFLVTRPHPEVT